jgi:hypothetical protein
VQNYCLLLELPNLLDFIMIEIKRKDVPLHAEKQTNDEESTVHRASVRPFLMCDGDASRHQA